MSLSFPLFHSLHAEGYAVAGVVDFYYLDFDLLLKVHHGYVIHSTPSSVSDKIITQMKVG